MVRIDILALLKNNKIKLHLKLYPFLNHYLFSPISQFYTLPFPRIISIASSVFIFPDIFSFNIFIYLSFMY